MYPILFKIGSLSISSFGLFLSLGLLFGTFIIWRLSKVYDLDPEKTLDLIFLTFFGGIIGGRLYYVLFHLSEFKNLTRIFLINRYPGLSFWGGFFIGFLILNYLTKRQKLNFWLVADLAAVGFFAGLSLGSLGCLLGSCQYGVTSNLPFAVTQIGVIGGRLPVQFGYFILFLLALIFLWRMCLRFHFTGKVASVALILLGLIKFPLDFYRGDEPKVLGNFNEGHFFAVFSALLGIVIYYRQSKKSFITDLKFLAYFFINSKVRNTTLSKFNKTWYNLKVNFRISYLNFKKQLFKKLNVKSNPNQF
ncbi:prolipoprotein diacylglyceryl transferase [Candidatus Daviesbacteria bacterium]|nr:prolipoprotein diacylglyceryl transferase [Candidatus Daviesbacteria bacterium]